MFACALFFFYYYYFFLCRLKLFRNVKLEKCFDVERATQLQSLWSEFLRLYEFLKADKVYTDEEISCFQKDTKRRVSDLFLMPQTGKNPRSKNYKLGMYSKENVTPYMHVFVYHVPEFLRYCATIGVPFTYFSCQALEKKNHQQVRLYFAKTKKGGGNIYCAAVKEIVEIWSSDDARRKYVKRGFSLHIELIQ